MGYQDSSNLYAYAKNDPINGSDPTGLCFWADDIDCRDYATDAFLQFGPWNALGNAKRSVSFAGSEVKGAVLAIPRLAGSVWHLGTHLPETGQALSALGSALINDFPGTVKNAYVGGVNAFINADPNRVGEFTGETLFFAGLGLAAKTPQGVAAIGSMKSAVSAGGRVALRPVFRAIGRMPVITARGRKLNVIDKTRRFFIQDTLTHPGVNYSPVGKLLKRTFPRLRLQNHQAVIQKAWYRRGSAFQWYPTDPLANAGMRRLGDAGWNLIPIPARLNNALGRTGLGTAAFAAGVYGSGAFTVWEAVDDDAPEE